MCSALLGFSSHVLALLDGTPSPSPSFFFFLFLAIASEHPYAYNFCYDRIHSQAQIPRNEILWSKGMKIFTALAEQNCHVTFLRGLTDYKTSELTNATVTLPAFRVIGLSVLS